MVKASAEQIKNALSKTGMKTLLDDGLEKVREGITTIDEVMRVTMLWFPRFSHHEILSVKQIEGD